MSQELRNCPLAEVRLCCGRLVLYVADIAVAMEGDKCRQMLPVEITEPVPKEELERAYVGNTPAKELPPRVLQFFRGEAWRSKSLEWAAETINRRTPDLSALHDLLAIIHRDGGQHTAAVGLEQSVIDAREVWAGLIQLPDSLSAKWASDANEAEEHSSIRAGTYRDCKADLERALNGEA